MILYLLFKSFLFSEMLKLSLLSISLLIKLSLISRINGKKDVTITILSSGLIP